MKTVSCNGVPRTLSLLIISSICVRIVFELSVIRSGLYSLICLRRFVRPGKAQKKCGYS